MTQHEQDGSPQTMHKVFIKYYDKLTNILNTSITNLSRYFVASNLITPEDEDEIFNATRDKARIFLLKIEAPVRGGFTDGFHLMLDIMLQRGSVADIQLAKQLRNEIDEEYKIEKLEKETKEVDVIRQEHINSLTLQLKRESDQKAVVEQLQQKIIEEDARHKQMDYNLDKEKDNNRRLYEQYLKTLKELQNLHRQHKVYIRNKIDYENRVSEQLKSLKAEKINTLQYSKEIKKQAATFEQDFKTEQQKCSMKDIEIASLKDQLQAAELGLKKDDEEWRKDCDALKEELELLKVKNEELEKQNKTLEQEEDDLKAQLQAAELGLEKDDEEWRKDCDALKKELELMKVNNEELEKQNKTLEQEVDDLKAQVQAAELALKKDDEEWRQDLNKISDENKSLTEEIDSLKQNIESLQQEKDTLEIENKVLKTEKESIKLQNDKLLKQQLEVALIGRRTSIEQLEDMETSLQATTQQNAVLKVANEEAEREIMLLNNDKSTITALEEQPKTKEKELTAANESLSRELTEVNAKLVSVSEENQRLHQSLSVELHSQKQSHRSLYNELSNIKLQLTKTTAEKEMLCKMHDESLNKANILQTDLLSTKAHLLLQKELQERDAKLLQIKEKREVELKATIDKLNYKIELLEGDYVKVQQTHSMITRFDHSQQHTTVRQGVIVSDDSCKEEYRPGNKMNNLLTSDPLQSLSASLYQSRGSEFTAKSNEAIFSQPVSQGTTTSLKLTSTSDLVEQVPPASNSLPLLQSGSTPCTTPLYVRKLVCTAKGEDAVKCKQIINITDLYCGQRVVIQRTNDKYEYGTVRALPEHISGNIGIELDLPNGISDGSADSVCHFDCKPNHGLFVPVEKLFRAVYTIN